MLRGKKEGKTNVFLSVSVHTIRASCIFLKEGYCVLTSLYLHILYFVVESNCYLLLSISKGMYLRLYCPQNVPITAKIHLTKMNTHSTEVVKSRLRRY